MSHLRVVNETRHTVLGVRVLMADSLYGRLRGFLFRKAPVMGEGILLTPCKGIHMYGMRFPLDVLFIEHTGRVMAIHEGLAPGRRTPVYTQSNYALELPAGAVAATRTLVGDQLSWSPAGGANGNIAAVIVDRKWKTGEVA
jgi:uncharacterized protein